MRNPILAVALLLLSSSPALAVPPRFSAPRPAPTPSTNYTRKTYPQPAPRPRPSQSNYNSNRSSQRQQDYRRQDTYRRQQNDTVRRSIQNQNDSRRRLADQQRSYQRQQQLNRSSTYNRPSTSNRTPVRSSPTYRSNTSFRGSTSVRPSVTVRPGGVRVNPLDRPGALVRVRLASGVVQPVRLLVLPSSRLSVIPVVQPAAPLTVVFGDSPPLAWDGVETAVEAPPPEEVSAAAVEAGVPPAPAPVDTDSVVASAVPVR
jgi:hypothetical protein